MLGTLADGPSVNLSFANNFWGKDDAGVEPLLQRMHNAKLTCDELKSFYAARATIEDEYARKLLSLSRKSLGSHEIGTLRTSLDVLRGEIEQMGKSHQNIASQMKTELEEPLAAFAGAMKERRKIVQNGIEKLLKSKVQQTNQVNKTRDRYEQECLKIKGYLAQGHMVMGQEERKNKAKLEKTQINLATSNSEYETAVKILEETTGRWNRDWKAAADKFQDLEEERLDFTKSSLWSFANIASTVCVSDDASCEKVRISLENCEVEKDIITFIKDCGTGQEIPDPPKYINFCRGDASDTQSEASEDDHYSVAQFPRTINPAYRSSSPQPSTYESHHDPQSTLARDLGHEPATSSSREATITPQKVLPDRSRQPQVEDQPELRQSPLDYQARISTEQQGEHKVKSIKQPQLEPRQLPLDYQVRGPMGQQQVEHKGKPMRQPHLDPRKPPPDYQVRTPMEQQNVEHKAKPVSQPQLEPQTQPKRLQYDQSQHGALTTVPHDPYPMDGMTMLCRTGPLSDRSSANSPGARPSSRDSQSEYSNPTSFSSHEPLSGNTSPVKRATAPLVEEHATKKKTGFFHSHSPFRRKSTKEKDNSGAMTPSNRNTWSARTTKHLQSTPSRRPRLNNQESQNMISDRPSKSPEPIDPRASFQLNVGNNVFDVASPEDNHKTIENSPSQNEEDLDPIARALEELKGVTTKASSTRVSADNYHGIATPAPGEAPVSRPGASQMAGIRGSPPPSYDQPVQRLGLPQPAFTSKAMQQTRKKYVDQTQNMFNSGGRLGSQAGHGTNTQSRPGTRDNDLPTATLSAPLRSISPRSDTRVDNRQAHRDSQAGYGTNAQSRPGTHSNDLPTATLSAPLRSISPRPDMRVDNKQAYRDSQAGYGTNAQSRPGTHSNDLPTATLSAPLRSISPRPDMRVDNKQAYRDSQAGYGTNTQSRPGTRGNDLPAATSPVPLRSVSPRPDMRVDIRQAYRSASPNPYLGSQWSRPQTAASHRARGSDQGYYIQNSPSDIRTSSPAPFHDQERPNSSHTSHEISMQMQLAPDPDYGYEAQRGRSSRLGGTITSRAMSQFGGAGSHQLATRQRSKSVADVRQYNSQGRPILHFARALYMYQAAIPEELGFAKGDILAVLRLQDDGWWEAEIAGKNGRPGLVPSNYLQNC